MTNSVIIVLIVAILIAWDSWLYYNFKRMTYNANNKAKAEFYASRYENVKGCLIDLICDIRKMFPNSTIEYISNNEGIDRVEGEIKY